MQRSQQGRPRSRPSGALLELRALRPQGQGDQALHHPQHGRICRYPYVPALVNRRKPQSIAVNCQGVEMDIAGGQLERNPD